MTDLLMTAGVKPMENTGPNWSYEGNKGPEHWGELDEDFRMCGEGQRQSPVDLGESSSVSSSAPLRILEGMVEGRRTEQRTTLKFIPEGSPGTLQWKGRDFFLQEFHFHTPSEHTVDDRRYPMETHFVHLDSEENLLVLGVFHTEGNAPESWREVQESALEQGKDQITVRFLELLPDSMSCFAYDGSLTTPPCSENVQWVMLDSPVEVEREWIRSFHNRFGPNNRPLQLLNGRTIYRYSS